MLLMLMEEDGSSGSQLFPDGENRDIYLRMVELERMRRRLEREKMAFEEIERHYGDLMDSEAFLYAFAAPDSVLTRSTAPVASALIISDLIPRSSPSSFIAP